MMKAFWFANSGEEQRTDVDGIISRDAGLLYFIRASVLIYMKVPPIHFCGTNVMEKIIDLKQIFFIVS